MITYITSVSILPDNKNDLLKSYDKYLQDLRKINNGKVGYPEKTNDKILTVQDLEETSDDILGDLVNLDERNKSVGKNQCPIMNPIFENLPGIPSLPPIPNIPKLPDLGFLKKFDIPVAGVTAMMGGYGRVLVKSSVEFAATKAKEELIKMSQGDKCVIEIANKLYVAMKSASDLQYLAAQTVATPTGVGTIIPT